AAIAVVAGQHHAGAAAAAHDAIVFDDACARAMQQNADAEVADLEATNFHTLCIDRGEGGIGQGAHVGAELTRRRARARLLTAVLDEAGTVERDEFAGTPPRHAFDAHRSLDRRQQRAGLDDVRALALRVDLDAEAAGRRVVALDRPAQRAFEEVVARARY